MGLEKGIYPPLIFLGIGALTDFGLFIANPITLLLGAAAQLGIFTTFAGAYFLGFTSPQSGAIGIIGGADGPTAIFVATKLAPELLAPLPLPHTPVDARHGAKCCRSYRLGSGCGDPSFHIGVKKVAQPQAVPILYLKEGVNLLLL